MRRPAPSAAEILDESGELVSSLGPWIGVCWLTALPLRLAQAHFAARLFELRGDAPAYGDHLRWLALLAGLGFLLASWGRAVFANACRVRLQGGADDARSVLGLPPLGLVSYVYVALAVEAVFYATCLSGVAAPALALLAGLAAVTVPFQERSGLLRPWSAIGASGPHVTPLILVAFAFGALFLLAAVNLLGLSQAGLWLAGGVAGLDVSRWSGLLAPGHPRFLCVLVACAWLLVEPWWLAALAVHVHKAEAASSGEDLRLWFARLRGGRA